MKKHNYELLNQELHKIRTNDVERHIRNFLGDGIAQENQGLVKKITINDLHILSKIAEIPDRRVNELLVEMVLTQGAVSKIVTKLANLGLVKKYHHPDNKKDTYLVVTPLGNQLAGLHARYHKELNQRMDKILTDYSDQEIGLISRFLRQVNEIHGD